MDRESFLETLRRQYSDEIRTAYLQCSKGEKSLVDVTKLHSLLSSLKADKERTFTGVTDHSPVFLNYLNKNAISLGNNIKVTSIEEYDQTYTLQLTGKKEVTVSFKVVNSLLVSR